MNLNKPPEKEVLCPECDGLGKTTEFTDIDSDATHVPLIQPCPFCNGTGKVKVINA
jgi:DnaJ-class molecular chaperone